jgi:hypothetical protein
MTYDKEKVKSLVCPLCRSQGTLTPIRPRRRFRAGPWSFALLIAKSHECSARGGTFNTAQLIEAQKAA